MKKIKKLETIEEYLDGALTGKELEEFEQTLKTDKSFAAEVRLYREINETLKETEILDLHEQLDTVYEKLSKEGKLESVNPGKEKKPLIRRIKWYYSAAAGVALLTGIAALLYFMLRMPLNERLYSENFGIYSFAERSDAPDAATKFDQALALYNSENYEEAWAAAKEVNSSSRSYITALFIQGISAMKINKHDDAVIAFDKIIKDNSTRYVERSEWYLALCYLKKEDMAKANALFKKIAEGNGFFRNKAKEILNRISE